MGLFYILVNITEKALIKKKQEEGICFRKALGLRPQGWASCTKIQPKIH
jgi:hypothetical protein